LNKLLIIQTLFQDADLPPSFSFLVAAGGRDSLLQGSTPAGIHYCRDSLLQGFTPAGIHSRFQMISLLWLLTGPYLHLLVSHLHYISRKTKKKYSTKLLTFWNDKKYFVQRFELVSKAHYLRFHFI